MPSDRDPAVLTVVIYDGGEETTAQEFALEHYLDRWQIDATGLHVRLHDAATDACTRHTWFPTGNVVYAEEAMVDTHRPLGLVKP